MIEGKGVNLRRVKPTDAGLLQRWVNTPNVMRYLRNSYPLDLEEVKDMILGIIKGRDRVLYMVELKETSSLPIGCCSMEIDKKNRRANIGILIDPECREGKPYGILALKVLIETSFEGMGLHRLSTYVHECDGEGMTFFEGMSFRKEAVLQDFFYTEGVHYNATIFRLLKSEWEE